MNNEASVHAAAMMLCALAGLGIGLTTDASAAEPLITPFLMAMLVFVFIDIEPKDLKRSFSDAKFTLSSLAINFIWTPLFAAGLGLLFFGDSEQARIGLMMLLAMPCTDWYLVFTASAKGDVALGSAILPMNLILQIVLIPVYVSALAGSDADFDITGMLLDSAVMLAIPAAAAVMLRLAGMGSQHAENIVSGARSHCGTLQLVFLCMAITAMFAAEARDVAENIGVIATLAAPMLIFFAATFVISAAASKAAGTGFDAGTSLIFTAMARNSPLALAIAASSFPESHLILVILAVAPMIELPVLSAASALRLKMRDARRTG